MQVLRDLYNLRTIRNNKRKHKIIQIIHLVKIFNACASFHLNSVYIQQDKLQNYDDKVSNFGDKNSNSSVIYSFRSFLMLRIYSTNSLVTSSSSTLLNGDSVNKQHLKSRDFESNRHYHIPQCHHRLKGDLKDTSFFLGSSRNGKTNFKVQNNSFSTRKIRPPSIRFDPRSVVLEWCQIRTSNYSVKYT